VDLYSALRENTSSALDARCTLRTTVSLKIAWSCLCQCLDPGTIDWQRVLDRQTGDRKKPLASVCVQPVSWVIYDKLSSAVLSAGRL